MHGSIISVIVAVLFGFQYQPIASHNLQPPLASSPIGMEHSLRADCLHPPNALVAENCLPGTDEWRQINSPTIQVYASTDSLNIGEKLDLFVDSTAPTFSLKIYRMGYYDGLGARLVQTVPELNGEHQPSCLRIDNSGLRTCSNWHVSYSTAIPMDWVSGVYAVFVKDSKTGASNQTVFTVRQDDRKSDMLYQMSVTTFQAYNNFAGKSIYSNNSGTCDTVANAPRAVKVSLNRPYNASSADPNYFFHTEYPMVRWLEQQGYDVTYSTNMDTHRSGKPGAHNALLDHKVFLSVGHDEYWSQQMRDAIIAARDAGVNIGFFGANTSYWRVRFEPDPITDEPDSVMVSYKTTESGQVDPSGIPTGTWRDSSGANQPENAVIGAMYHGYNLGVSFPLRLSSEYTSDSLFRHTGLQNMPPDTYLDVGTQVVGWEWDATYNNGFSPKGVQILARTPLIGSLPQDAGKFMTENLQQSFAEVTRYTAPSGAIVFAGGTIQWSRGYGITGANTIPPDPYITQITYNLFSDMGVKPASPDSTLILDGSNTPDLLLPIDKLKKVGFVRPPTIKDIQITEDGTNLQVNWNTDVETIGQVWYGTDANHINTNVGTDLIYSTNHNLVVYNLEQVQRYYFKVVAFNHDWGQTLSDAQSFTTSKASLIEDFSNIIQPTIQRGSCWLSANRNNSIFLGVMTVVFALMFIVRIMLRYQWRIFFP